MPRGGLRNPRGGRPKGSRDKVKRSDMAAFKEATIRVFRDIGGEKAYAVWAKKNRTEFYKLYERMTPKDIDLHADGQIIVEAVQFTASVVLPGPRVVRDINPQLEAKDADSTPG